MKLAVSSLVLLAALSAAADGFLLSTNAIPPARRAALEALCGRLEARGVARVPAGAEWTDLVPLAGVNDEEFFFGHILSRGQRGASWRIQKDGQSGPREFVSTAGFRFWDSTDDFHLIRPARDASTIVNILHADIAAQTGRDKDSSVDHEFDPMNKSSKGKRVGCVLIFAAQLFRAGFEAEAEAIIGALEKARGLESAEADALRTLNLDY